MRICICAVVISFSIGSAFRAETWSKEKSVFELRGTVALPDGRLSAGGNAIVQISATFGQPGMSTVADSSGKFRFKKVPAGMYLLTAFVPRVARTRKTIEVGPSFADEKGRINISLKLEARPRRPERFQVSAQQLGVPEKARGEYEKGRERLTKQDLAGASECFRKALDFAPHFAAAHYQLGTIASQEERFPEAATRFRAALQYLPGNYQALLNLGSVLLAMNDGLEAVEVNKQAVQARPEDPQAQAQLGNSYFLIGRLDDAERHLKTTISLDPANFFYPQLMLAEIYRRRQDMASMIRELESFIRLHPDSQKALEITPILEEIRAQVTQGGAPAGPR